MKFIQNSIPIFIVFGFLFFSAEYGKADSENQEMSGMAIVEPTVKCPKVSASHEKNKKEHKYCYSLKNRCQDLTLDLTALTIGAGAAEPELSAGPVGWPGSKIKSATPRDWKVRVWGQEDSSKLSVTFEIREKTSHTKLPPAAEIAGFCVFTKDADGFYESGHWSLIGDNVHATSTLSKRP